MIQYPSVADNNPAPLIHALGNGSITYYGYAPLGTPTNVPSWKILRQEDVSDGAGGTITTIGSALGTNGVPSYREEFVWDDRLSYQYGR
jgi:hypothetical protein